MLQPKLAPRTIKVSADTWSEQLLNLTEIITSNPWFQQPYIARYGLLSSPGPLEGAWLEHPDHKAWLARFVIAMATRGSGYVKIEGLDQKVSKDTCLAMLRNIIWATGNKVDMHVCDIDIVLAFIERAIGFETKPITYKEIITDLPRLRSAKDDLKNRFHHRAYEVYTALESYFNQSRCDWHMLRFVSAFWKTEAMDNNETIVDLVAVYMPDEFAITFSMQDLAKHSRTMARLNSYDKPKKRY